MGLQAALLEPLGERAMQPHMGLAAGVVEDLAGTPGHGQVQAQADGLREGLLGREPGGQIAEPARFNARAPGLEHLPFAGSQHLLGKAIATTLQGGGDAPQVAHIGADAVDHGGAARAQQVDGEQASPMGRSERFRIGAQPMACWMHCW